jgi:ABC-type cobalamin/Fe3+-siderophores transport system ATPase subunit
MSTVLKYENVSIYYDDHLILKDINIHIQKGDFIYLLGKSGSGKTSFIKTIYADIPIKSGSSLHASPLGCKFKQLMVFANTRAQVVFPTPLGPKNK